MGTPGRRLEVQERRLGSALAIDFKVKIEEGNTAMQTGIVDSLSTGQASFVGTFTSALTTKATEGSLDMTVDSVIVDLPAVVVEVEVTSETTTTTTTTSSSGIDAASMPSAIFSIVFVCLLQMLE